MKASLYIFAIAAVLGVGEGHSQTRRGRSLSFGWGVSVPAGDGNFCNRICLISPRVDWERRLAPFLSAGFSAGYASSSEQGITRDRFDGNLTDGFTDRKLLLIPAQVKLRLFVPGRRWLPYICASGGMQYARFNITGSYIPASVSKSLGALASVGGGLRFYPGRLRIFFVEIGGAWQCAGNRLPIMASGRQRTVEIHLGVGCAVF